MASVFRRGPVWRGMVRKGGLSLTRTFDTEADARQWAAREEARIAKGNPVAPVANLGASATVAELMARYAREVSPDKGGWRWEVIRLRRMAAEFDMKATDLDGANVAEWRDVRLKTVGASTVNRELNLLSAVLTRAIKEWRIGLTVNPVHTIQRPKMPPNRRRRVPDRDKAAILAQLGWDGATPPDKRKEWVAWGFCLALETMMRKGEILGLTWDHVHLDKRYVHLPKTKNGHPRNVPLSSRAVALLAMLTPQHPEARVVPVQSGTFGQYFTEAVRAAGVRDLHFHDSRREALTTLAPKFGNPMDLGAASGHRDSRSLRIYYEPDVSDLAAKLG